MFNPLTRTLKIGLTALAILIAGVGAGTAFAHGHVKGVSPWNDRVAYCQRHPTSTLCGSTRTARDQFASCIANPFGTGCRSTFTPQQLIVAKTRYCTGNQSNHHCIREVLARPNAAQWFRTHGRWLPIVMDTTRGSHFLRGWASGLDATNTASSRGYVVQNNTTVNFKTARYNGATLDGNATDGFSFFRVAHLTAENGYDYAGILGGTNLGAPVTHRTGTARWAGQVSVLAANNDGVQNRSFVLGVDFDNRTISAFTPYISSYNYNYKLYMQASYDANGVFLGTTRLAQFTNNDPLRPIAYLGGSFSGRLRGFIGEEGAVGIFVREPGSDSFLFTGGFVARPAENVDGASESMQVLCERAPSTHNCSVSDRRIATIVTNCRNNPWGTTASEYGNGGCVKTFGTEIHKIAKAGRIILCNNATDGADSSRCTHPDVVTEICKDNLFGVGCSRHTSYNSNRETRAKICAYTVNRRDPRCTSYQSAERANICRLVPFGTACTSFEDERRERAAICAVIVNQNDPRCTTGQTGGQNATLANVCRLVPFGARCASGTYENHRVRQVTTCAGNLSASGCGSSYGLPKSKVCNLVPFGGECTSVTYKNKRMEQVTTCAANMRASGCGSSYGLPESKVCKLVPFGIYCEYNANYQSDRVTRAKFCAYTVNRNDPLCTIGQTEQNATLTNVCRLVPFGTACTRFTNKRRERAKICAATANRRDPRCTTGQTGGQNATLANVCRLVPFGTACTSTTYQSYRLARANTCVVNPNDLDCKGQVSTANICSQIPFVSICVDIDSPDSSDYETARQRTFKYCRRNLSDPKCYGIEPGLEDEAKKPNLATWVDSQFTSENPTGIVSTPYTGGKKGNQFLKGRTDDLNKGDLVVNDSDRGGLNLEQSFYKYVPLDGNYNNGVAFFAGKISSEERINTNPLYYYAGLFSYTDLGAPVSGADGATASWVGSFAATNLDQNKDIVLTITFGSEGGDIDAFVETADVKDFLIDGHFNADGVIGGRVAYKEFAANERTIANDSEANGDLTGLIGVKGAIGAFISDDTGPTGYAGGFVARPVLELTGVLNQVCGNGINDSVTNGDPFHPFCELETDKQRKRFETCSEGNNANHPGCAGALAVHGCIADPFAANCKSDSDFATARQNRINFCNGSGVEDALCKTDKLANICDYAPFSPICSKHAGSAGRRTEVAFNECRNNGTGVDDCHGIAPALADGDKGTNAATWADSFVTFADYKGLGDKPEFPPKSQFLKGSPHWVSSEGIYVYSQNFHKNLNLSNARFKNIPLGGFAGDGVGYFWGRHNNVYFGYAGIFSGTDLGAPVSETSGTTASWVGHIQAFGKTLGGGRRGVNKGFVLEVTFGNDDADKAGSIAAFVRTEGNFNYLLSGTFDNHGVISGTTTWSNFINRDRNTPTGEKNLGTLTGLIGEQGAVGGFHSNYSGEKSYGGGFVARPVDAVRNAWSTAQAALNTACNTNPFEDPNRELCYLEYAKARVATIDDCLESDGTVKTSSKCTIATDHNSCINNPFAIGCDTDTDFKDFHVKARENRIEFCNKEGNPDNSLCMPTEVVTAICDDYLFGTGCLSHTDYNDKRIERADFCTANMSDPKCDGHGVTTADICSQIPFKSICTGYDDERLDRANFCANDDNETNPFCDKQYVTTANICSQIPFDTFCAGNASFAPDRTERIRFCNDGGSQANNPRCTPTEVVDAICEDNLFGTGCLTDRDHDAEREALIRTCNEEISKNTAPCKLPDVITAICTANLFGTGCLTDRDHDVVRAALITTCNKDGSRTSDSCKPTDVVNAVCENNIFGTGCLLHSHSSEGPHAVARKERLELCDTDSGNSLCTGANLNSMCSYAPFSPVCLGHTISAPKRTESDFEACRAPDTDDLKCHGVRPRPSSAKLQTINMAAWSDNFVTKSNPNGLSLVADTNKRGQFLEADKGPLDQTGVNARTSDELDFIDIPHLKLSRLNADIPETEEFIAKENGVAFFWGTADGGGRQILASGILSGTDLGAPVIGLSGTKAVWQGVFQSLWIATRTEFELTITFDGSTGSSNTGMINAFIERDSSDSYASSIPHYYLDGQFGANGLITGRVLAGTFRDGDPDNRTGSFYQGVLKGLIGEDGAVGAFVGGTSTDNGVTITHTGYFAGGFVARSFTVNYDAWVDADIPLDIATTSSTTNRFLKTTGHVLNKGSLSGSSIAVTMKSAQHNGVALAGNDADGFAYLSGSVNHVGILANTSLGAPLNRVTAEGTWKGSFVSAEGSTVVKKDFTLDVNFPDRKVSATIETTPYTFSGLFDTRGVIEGTITRAATKPSEGIMTGLIGSVGAVGVFISNPGEIVSYGGGFVACPLHADQRCMNAAR